MQEEQKISDIIAEMQSVLIERGRCKRQLEMKMNGRVCLLGAAAVAQQLPTDVDMQPGSAEQAAAYAQIVSTPVVNFLTSQLPADGILGLALFNDNAADDSVILDFLHGAQLAAKEQGL